MQSETRSQIEIVTEDHPEILSFRTGALLLYAILLILGYFSTNEYIKLAIVIFVFYTGWVYRVCNLALLYVAVAVAIDISLPVFVTMVATAPLYFCALRGRSISRKSLLSVIMFGAIVLISFMLGTDSNIRTAGLFILALFLFMGMSEKEYYFSEVKKYAYLAFIVVGAIFLIQIFNGGITLMYGRLSLNDNIREAANAIAFPLIVSLESLLNGAIKNKSETFFNILIIAVGTLILIATLSKGTIIAVFVAFGVSFLLIKGRTGRKVFLFILAGIVLYVVINYLSSLDLFRLERLTEGSSGFSGRIDIWQGYLSEMGKDVKTVFFGFGPGDIKRLGISSYYSHSLFMDVLFSYGIVGMTAFTGMVVDAGLKVFRSRNIAAISLFVFICLLCATHGSSTYLTFYVVMAVCVGLIEDYVSA